MNRTEQWALAVAGGAALVGLFAAWKVVVAGVAVAAGSWAWRRFLLSRL